MNPFLEEAAKRLREAEQTYKDFPSNRLRVPDKLIELAKERTELAKIDKGLNPALPMTARCGGGYRGCQGRGTLRIDTYDRELNDRTIFRYLCDICEQELRDDI